MKRTDFKDPFKGHCGYYHLSSHHLETQRIFRNDSDYIFGVNSLALLLSGSQVQVIAYCLMDNHLHLLLAGEYERCLGYYGKVLHRIAQYVKINYGVSGILRKEDVDIVAVLTGQQLKEEICYIHRNPYKARIDSPLAYRGSSADVYFNSSISTGVQVKTIPIKDRKVLFKTHIPVNDEYEHRDGKILNASFVAYKEASERFRDSVEYFDILRKYSLEAEVESKHGIEESIVFSDSELQEKIAEICKYEFHSDSLGGLDRKSLLRLASTVGLRFGARPKQLSRLLGIDKDVLDRIL